MHRYIDDARLLLALVHVLERLLEHVEAALLLGLLAVELHERVEERERERAAGRHAAKALDAQLEVLVGHEEVALLACAGRHLAIELAALLHQHALQCLEVDATSCASGRCAGIGIVGIEQRVARDRHCGCCGGAGRCLGAGAASLPKAGEAAVDLLEQNGARRNDVVPHGNVALAHGRIAVRPARQQPLQRHERRDTVLVAEQLQHLLHLDHTLQALQGVVLADRGERVQVGPTAQELVVVARNVVARSVEVVAADGQQRQVAEEVRLEILAVLRVLGVVEELVERRPLGARLDVRAQKVAEVRLAVLALPQLLGVVHLDQRVGRQLVPVREAVEALEAAAVPEADLEVRDVIELAGRRGRGLCARRGARRAAGTSASRSALLGGVGLALLESLEGALVGLQRRGVVALELELQRLARELRLAQVLAVEAHEYVLVAECLVELGELHPRRLVGVYRDVARSSRTTATFAACGRVLLDGAAENLLLEQHNARVEIVGAQGRAGGQRRVHGRDQVHWSIVARSQQTTDERRRVTCRLGQQGLDQLSHGSRQCCHLAACRIDRHRAGGAERCRQTGRQGLRLRTTLAGAATATCGRQLAVEHGFEELHEQHASDRRFAARQRLQWLDELAWLDLHIGQLSGTIATVHDDLVGPQLTDALLTGRHALLSHPRSVYV